MIQSLKLSFSYFTNSVISLLGIIVLTFCFMKLIPGDPFLESKALDEHVHQRLLDYHGLNGSLTEQLLTYLKNVSSFNLGTSLKYKDLTVIEIIVNNFPISAQLGGMAFLASMINGIFLGTLSAYHYKKKGDQVFFFSSTLALSLPTFFIGTFLQYYLSFKWHIFPIGRWGSISHAILPILTLSIIPSMQIAKLVRVQVLQIFQKNYYISEKLKGLPPISIYKNCIFKNSLLPLFPFFGQLGANLLTGSFIVEKIFAIPGLGFWYVQSIGNRDYPVIMGLTIFYSTLLLGFILLSEVLQRLLNPLANTKIS
ncbi:MAG: hypothetical protein BGO10_06340 [Chlamydia sp. 32-24]|nr:MAG: hypothetical protein BGO10_06340 [Chlamydia sp. 32-24]